jgi:hypothetical protein
MIAYCGCPSSASFCDRFPYIGPRYARETIAETCSMRGTLATAIISQAGSLVTRAFFRRGARRSRHGAVRTPCRDPSGRRL